MARISSTQNLPRLKERALDVCNYLRTLFNPPSDQPVKLPNPGHRVPLANLPPDSSLFHIQHHSPSNHSILSLSSQVYEDAMPRTLQSTMLVPSIIHRLVSILNIFIALLAVLKWILPIPGSPTLIGSGSNKCSAAYAPSIVRPRTRSAHSFPGHLYNLTFQLVRETINSSIYYIASDSLRAKKAVQACP